MNIARWSQKPLSLTCAAVFGAVCLFATPATAAPPTQILQQGRLLDESGEPKSGMVDMQFTIYNAETAGEILWQDEIRVELDDNGFYTVSLGEQGSPLNAAVFAADQTWIGVALDGEDELTPRFQFHSVPYALTSDLAIRALVADQVAAGAVTREALAEDVFEQTAAAVSCAPGQVPVSSSTGWECGELSGGLTLAQVRDALGSTLGDLSCAPNQIPSYDGSQWTCAWQMSYTAGDHLTLNGNTFSVDTTNLDAASLGGTPANAYLTQAQAQASYLPLSGGTLQGDLRVREFEIVKAPDNSVSSGYIERDTTRLVIRNQRRRETVPIPSERLHDLCHDGCTYTISMRYWGNSNVELGSRGPYVFSYDEPSGRWRDSRNANGVAGAGSADHVINAGDWGCCYFTEGEYIAGVAQGDSTREMHLLNYSSTTCPLNSNSSLECILTFSD
ncbi:hypothetical protein DL240_14680 [Lujinxingia litoralis]|uniref:Uncharacterized protein n=1 Tax=Lujinxingia litoralis TaxID=2211119 RepID=A0A328C2I9_9DELT|nr:hypothetical protein [Lujinxingia litoralis]RAL20917.1 hypothetical protein DL240_14680 [Lujinxingia litoralis]